MSILITGYRGFIGRALTTRLEAEGMAWLPFSGDVTAPADFDRVGLCRAVVHLAGLTRVAGPSDAIRAYTVNLTGTLNAARFALKRGVPLLFTGSCPYATDQRPPFHEGMRLDTRNLGPYPSSKALSDEALLSMGRQAGLRGYALRIFNLYGPGQPQGFLIPDILEKVRTRRCEMYNLDPIRDFIHMDDLITLMVAALREPDRPIQPVNVGTGLGASVRQVLDLIQELLGCDLKVSSRNLPSPIQVSVADIGTARRLFGWEPTIPLARGLAGMLGLEAPEDAEPVRQALASR